MIKDSVNKKHIQKIKLYQREDCLYVLTNDLKKILGTFILSLS